MWGLLIFGALTAAWIWRGRRRYLKHQSVWEKALESCGFEVEWRSSSGGEEQAWGVRAGAKVRIEDSPGGGVVVVAHAPRSLSECSGVKISHEGYAAAPSPARAAATPAAARPPEGRELETGDELFDSKLSIAGPEQLLRALLDAKTRRLLLGLNAGDRLEISGREIRVQTSGENLRNVLSLVPAIGRRFDRRFARRADLVQALSENASDDPEAGVRLQNLLLLIRKHPERFPTGVALRKACSDPAPEIRLRAAAAMALGGDRNGLLVDLAESLVDDRVSAEAVSTLGRTLPFERRRAILGQALDRSLVRTACACLEALGRSGNPAAVGVLAEVMERKGGKIAAAAAVALGETGRPAAEPPLLLALQREDTQATAVDALALVGTAAAVLPLEEAAERTKDKVLRRAARRAVAEIQSRLQGASPGQLSLAEAEAGQLSLAEGEAGRLSLASSEAGQLSLNEAEAGPLSLAPAEAGPLSLAPAEIPLLPHPVDEPERPSRTARETPGVRQG